MRKIINWLLDWLYPTRCVFCRGRIRPGRPGICRTCGETIPLSIHTSVQYIDKCVSACFYEDTVRAAIHRYKFDGVQAYAYAFSEWVAARINEELWDSYDILSWVPLAADRKRKRGYDQTELIARYAAKRLRVRAVPTLEKRSGVSQQSKTADAASRRANILGAYTVPDPELIRNKRVLLIDDIITTGATLSECAKTLITAGASGVVCATLAKTPQRNGK